MTRTMQTMLSMHNQSTGALYVPRTALMHKRNPEVPKAFPDFYR